MTAAGPWSTTRALGVLGTGWAVPHLPVTTDALLALMAASFGFTGARQGRALAARLGVEARHIGRPFAAACEPPRPGQSNPELAARALRRALDRAGLTAGDLGYLVAHTATPARALPANVADVADLLGYAGPCVELRQACTGFGNALMIAHGLIAAEPSRPVAIVGSETGSQFFDPATLNGDHGQLVNLLQMGDGAGAIILGPPSPDRARLAGAWFGGIGHGRAPGIARAAAARHFDHDFAAVRATGPLLFDAGAAAAAALGCAPADADRIIPHQVGGRVGALLAARLGVDAARMVFGADRFGNTGSAAIWLALAQYRESALRPGERALVLGAEASKHFHTGFVHVA